MIDWDERRRQIGNLPFEETMKRVLYKLEHPDPPEPKKRLRCFGKDGNLISAHDNIINAAKALKISSMAILRVLNGKNPDHHGITFRWE